MHLIFACIVTPAENCTCMDIEVCLFSQAHLRVWRCQPLHIVAIAQHNFINQLHWGCRLLQSGQPCKLGCMTALYLE